MATIFNESTVAATPAGKDAARQQLLTEARVPGSGILLDRLTLTPGGEARLAVPATSVAWIQPLDGQALLSHDDSRQTLTDAHVAFLPPGFAATISSAGGAALLYGKFPTPDVSMRVQAKPAAVPAGRLDARAGARFRT